MARLGAETKLFGSRLKTSVLTLLALLDESYPSELAKMLEVGLFAVQKVVNALEVEGVIVGRASTHCRHLAALPQNA